MTTKKSVAMWTLSHHNMGHCGKLKLQEIEGKLTDDDKFLLVTRQGYHSSLYEIGKRAFYTKKEAVAAREKDILDYIQKEKKQIEEHGKILEYYKRQLEKDRAYLRGEIEEFADEEDKDAP